MQIDYNKAILDLEDYLKKNKTWVLSTSLNDYVTSRMMSIINQGVEIYFQTNHCYIKDEQMSKNPNISLCCGNYSIEGIAIPIGDWNDEANKELEKIYIKEHKSSYDFYGALSGQVIYKVIPKLVKIWKYVDGFPIRECIDFTLNKAERYDCGSSDMMADLNKKNNNRK
ncbi:hypothetical protein MKC54_19530 [[Clostridium] innocuum]|nr:hypothetical protein [[Clostridium] innocuum]MCR0579091.1 hypothetical protein [[Clostridium] innocuum]